MSNPYAGWADRTRSPIDWFQDDWDVSGGAVAVAEGPALVPSPEVSARFEVLAEQWRRETSALSSITKRVAHPAYAKIVGLGASAIPLILAELEQRPDLWFHALYNLTHADPVRDEDRGNLPRMTDAWLQWGKQKGYLGT